MRANWCRSCGSGANFGDQLTPALLQHFGIRATWAPPARADLVCVGSILSKIPNGWAGTVLGTGFIRGGVRKDLRAARVLAVRGLLTRAGCKVHGDVVLGDPGILAIDLLTEPEPGGALAIPHYVDHDLVRRHPEATYLDIRSNPAAFIRKVAGATIVYTSSLHALIAADALGVPHVLEPHPGVVGGMWKFRDYGSAFAETIRPHRKRLTPRRAMAARQAEIRGLFIGLDSVR